MSEGIGPNEEPASDEDAISTDVERFEPTTEQFRDLKLAHDNAGHPTNADFARLLRRGSCRPEIASWVRKHFSCEACETNRKPKARRPAAAPHTFRVNHVVGIDLVQLKGCDRRAKEYWLNVVCWGSGYQMEALIPDKTSKTSRDAFAEVWIKHYGWPELLATDQGPEFIGHEFSIYVGENGCLQHFIDSQSPWQQGRNKRAGASLKQDLLDVIEQCAIVTRSRIHI